MGEVYDAMRAALAEIPDDRLNWQPASDCLSASMLVQHIRRANVTYSQMMGIWGNAARSRHTCRTLLVTSLLEHSVASGRQVGFAFEAMTPERLHETVCDDWAPIGFELSGPLTPLWFANTILVHSAYHVGQLVTLGLLISNE